MSVYLLPGYMQTPEQTPCALQAETEPLFILSLTQTYVYSPLVSVFMSSI